MNFVDERCVTVTGTGTENAAPETASVNSANGNLKLFDTWLNKR